MTMQDLIAQVGPLTDAVKSIGGAVDGFIAFDKDIQAQLDAAIANGSNPADIQAVSDALAANIAEATAQRDKLVAATVRGTPAQP